AIGASQLNTFHVVRQLTQNNHTVVPHISCVGMTTSRLEQILQDYRGLGIKQLVAVRGDAIQESEKVATDFNYASDLVAGIRRLTGDYFHITVAAYPEFHPEAISSEQDLIHFKRKVEAGANSAITQFFYNSDAYARFLECCEKLNINLPIIPG